MVVVVVVGIFLGCEIGTGVIVAPAMFELRGYKQHKQQ